MTSDYTDHRRAAAVRTGDRNAAQRGWDFSAIVDTAPWPVRVVEVLFRPSSVFSLSLLAVCVWLLVTQ